MSPLHLGFFTHILLSLNLMASILRLWVGYVCVNAKSIQLCPTLCDPMDYSSPGSSVHGILQAKILEWVAMPSSRGSSQPRDWTHASCGSYVAGRSFTAEPLGKPRVGSTTYVNIRRFTWSFPRASKVSFLLLWNVAAIGFPSPAGLQISRLHLFCFYSIYKSTFSLEFISSYNALPKTDDSS